ncbi:MAG: winged helix-turn-helix domain-containing protein, partial [Chloroflexota bacterium]
FTINDLDTLKVIADPLRLQVIEIIFDHPHTVKQVAHKLEIPQSKLYYHINLLEKHALIAVASTRIVSGIVEKSYQASARNFRVKKGLLNPASPDEDAPEGGMSMFVDAILDNAKQDIKRNAANGLINLSEETSPLNLNISRMTTRLTEDEALELQERLKALSKEFHEKKKDGANADEQTYALVFALYPTMRGSRPNPDDEPDVELE